MKLIQLILGSMLAFAVVLYFRRFRTRLMDRLIVLSLGLFGMLLVLVPEWANLLAHLVGVGRGADLILYLGLLGLAFLCLVLYSKLRQVEMKLTLLARAEALAQAHLPEPNASWNSKAVDTTRRTQT